MNAQNWIELLVPILMSVGILYGVVRWITRIDANTDATRDLTTEFRKFSEQTGDHLLDHEVRIVKIEAKLDSGKLRSGLAVPARPSYQVGEARSVLVRALLIPGAQ